MSDIDSMKEVAGEGALLVDPFDVTSIRRKVIFALESDLNEVIAQGFSNVSRFRANQIIGRYQKSL